MQEKLRILFDNSKQAVSYMVEEITHICRDMETRGPGSRGEREAGVYMAGVLEKDCGCNDVKTESFREHPAAFYGYFFLTAALNCLCAGTFFLLPWLSLVFGVATLFLFLFQFVLYKQLIDPLFPEKESLNVTAIRSCSGQVRQRVFLNGHIDAPWEFPLNYYCGGIVFEIPGAMSVLGAVFFTTISVCRLCGAGSWVSVAGLCGLVFIPFYILLAFTYNPKRIVDGANDNLSGCYMGIAVLREMERLGVVLQHTEVGVLLTGSEEAGLRGAKAWCKAHKKDFKDVPTYILCFDTIHDPRQLMVNLKDLNGTVTADRETGERFLDAAVEAGVPCKKGYVPMMGGSTDSAAFTQGGFRSVAITGLSHRLEDYYHTRKDSCDNLDEEGLENCYKAAICFLQNMENAQ